MFYINTDYISSENYALEKLIPFNVDNYDVLNSYFLENLRGLNSVGTFTVTVEEFRPELISYKIYNTVYYWAILLMYNNILDLTDLKNGKVLNYFSASDLETLFYNLKSLQG
jgi:hypothetical protein